MEKNRRETMLEIKELLLEIHTNPQNYLGISDKRIDYLFYFLMGRLDICHDKNYGEFREKYSHWIYDWIKDNSDKSVDLKHLYSWHKMIYSITDSEEEAWDLFFKIADEYFEQLHY